MAGKKHILFISSWYPSEQDPTLGIFNRYFASAASLYNTVSIIHVISAKGMSGDLETECSNDEGMVMITVKYRKVEGGLSLIRGIKKRKRVLTAFEVGYQKLVNTAGEPDIIHLNVVMPMGIGALHLASKHKLPLVVNENWSGYTSEDNSYRGFLTTYFTRKILRYSKAIMPTSTYLRNAMLSHGLKGNYQVVPNAVNVDLFRPLEKKPGHQKIKLLHISSLNDREKNVSGLIRAFAAACEKDPNLELNIVGEGTDKQLYEKLVSKLSLTGRVFFRGRLFGEDLVDEINTNHVLVMFSNFETFCLVIIEAFACGKPVITSNAGAIKTYMKPELGIMVNVGDEKAFTKAILDFASQPDRFESSYIRQYAVDNYSYAKVGHQLDEIYAKALKK
jgi:glycosyltransferase involved in cell wall biosynthesis